VAHVWRGIVREYLDHLPFDEGDRTISLGEGGTPLVHAPSISAQVGADVWVKVEGMNPTGSFKDRGMTSAITQVVKDGDHTVVCASTGNTSASAAAYAAHAGLRCVVMIPQGKIAAGKMAQAIVHGADLVQVDGNFDECLDIVRSLSENYPIALVNSVNPYRLQGQKTAAFEIVDQLGDAPDIHMLPVGNAGNISAYWMGFTEYADAGIATRRPRIWGVQAAGAAPFVAGHPSITPRPSPPRSASASPLRGTSRSPLATNPAAGSVRSVTSRFLPHRRSSRRTSASSSSPPRPRRSPDCSRRRPQVRCPLVQRSRAPSRATD
jgi:threonine synthase